MDVQLEEISFKKETHLSISCLYRSRDSNKFSKSDRQLANEHMIGLIQIDQSYVHDVLLRVNE